MLNQFIAAAKEYHVPAYAVTIIRDGVSETARITPANDCNDIYSISKNFTATAIGMLCDRGILSVDTRVYDVLSPMYPDMPTVWKTNPRNQHHDIPDNHHIHMWNGSNSPRDM